MGLTELLVFVGFCNAAAAQVVLPPETATICGLRYEELKQEVADGDYAVYREWYAENAPAVQDRVDAMVADYLRHIGR